LSYLLIYRHIKTSSEAVNYSSTLSGNTYILFESYKSEVSNLLNTHSGSFTRKDYDNYYDIVYKFESMENLSGFYNAIESSNASNTIIEYRTFKFNNPNEVVKKIKVILKNNETTNTINLIKTIEM
jgi:hypothetical protein